MSSTSSLTRGFGAASFRVGTKLENVEYRLDLRFGAASFRVGTKPDKIVENKKECFGAASFRVGTKLEKMQQATEFVLEQRLSE